MESIMEETRETEVREDMLEILGNISKNRKRVLDLKEKIQQFPEQRKQFMLNQLDLILGNAKKKYEFLRKDIKEN